MCEQLLAEGIRYVFGNPGTVEQGFLDALTSYPALQYVCALQETVAVGIADGYARATHGPAVVQLHSGVGLGNGIGMLYQAMRGHSPLVVLAGDAGVQYEAMDAQMAADLVGMARPVTKWAGRVTHPSSLLRMLRRAIKIASTPPMGPVFLALPMDVLDAPNAEDVVVEAVRMATRTVPEPALITQAARLLAGATQPVIIVGDGVAFSAAQPELARVAEVWGAPVWAADSSEVNLSSDNPHFRGLLGHMFAKDSQPITMKADAVLICGTYVFPEVFPALSDVFAANARVVHIDLDTDAIAKNFPVDLGLVSDPKLTLARLAESLEQEMSPGQEQDARERSRQLGTEQRLESESKRRADQARREDMPMPASRFMAELAELVPDDVIVFDEALTTSPDLVRYLPPSRPGDYFQTRGGSLGVGIPRRFLGGQARQPRPDRLRLRGRRGRHVHDPGAVDGRALPDRRQDRHLQQPELPDTQRQHPPVLAQTRDVPEHEFPASFYLREPELRFDRIAESLGVPAARVEAGEQVRPAISRALETDGPFLIDVVIDGGVPEGTGHVKCGL